MNFESFDDEKELSFHVAINFFELMELKRTFNTDECFCMSLNYVYIMNIYWTLSLSMRAGDAVMIEWIYKDFLPILLVTRKTHYL